MSQETSLVSELAARAPFPPLSEGQIEEALNDIAALEARYDLRLPEDFRDHLLRIGPGTREVWDNEDVLWWPTGRLRNVVDEYEHPVENPQVAREADKYVFFADLMIWCWAWAICCSDGPNRGKVVVFSEAQRFVADSFSDFLRQFLDDPSSID